MRINGGDNMRRASILLLSMICLTACNNEDIGIIGGADGPTSIFIGEHVTDTENNESEIIPKIKTDELSGEEIIMQKTLTPTGFAGSSFNRIELYSNGNVYWIQYDGAGFDYENIVRDDLVASNAADIEMFEDEGINIIGENLKVVEDINNGWLKVNNK